MGSSRPKKLIFLIFLRLQKIKSEISRAMNAVTPTTLPMMIALLFDVLTLGGVSANVVATGEKI